MKVNHLRRPYFNTSLPQKAKPEEKNPIITKRRISEKDWQLVKANTAKEMFEACRIYLLRLQAVLNMVWHWSCPHWKVCKMECRSLDALFISDLLQLVGKVLKLHGGGSSRDGS